MPRYLFVLMLAIALAGAAAAATPEPIVVTPAWLAAHLQDPDLVVLHVAALRDDYTREHIPGARFLWLSWLAVSTPDLGFEMPPVDSLATALRRLGVSNDSRIVLYHVLGDVTGTARVFVTLDDLGLGQRTRILDGGLAAWKAAGLAVTKDEPRFGPGSFTPAARPNAVIHLDAMRARYRAPGVQLLDARSPQDFNALPGRSVVRGGHIPGALNLPLAALFDTLDCYQPLDTLAVRFQRAGVQPGSELITYCGVGRTACPAYVAARMLGYAVRLYDGSFAEWARQEELPVENSKRGLPPQAPRQAASSEYGQEREQIAQVISSCIGWAKDKNLDLLYSVIAHDDDYLSISPGSRVVKCFEDVKQNVPFWMSPDFKYVRHELRDLEITFARGGEVAWFYGVLDDINTYKGEPASWENARWTGVVEKRQDKWVIVQQHFSFASDR